jgi:hypothetical protein
VRQDAQRGHVVELPVLPILMAATSTQFLEFESFQTSNLGNVLGVDGGPKATILPFYLVFPIFACFVLLLSSLLLPPPELSLAHQTRSSCKNKFTKENGGQQGMA